MYYYIPTKYPTFLVMHGDNSGVLRFDQNLRYIKKDREDEGGVEETTVGEVVPGWREKALCSLRADWLMGTRSKKQRDLLGFAPSSVEAVCNHCHNKPTCSNIIPPVCRDSHLKH